MKNVIGIGDPGLEPGTVIGEIIDSSYKPRKAFTLDEKEQAAYGEFIEKHRKSCPERTAIGGNYSITFEITTLGTIKIVKCAVCRETKNITNFENW